MEINIQCQFGYRCSRQGLGRELQNDGEGKSQDISRWAQELIHDDAGSHAKFYFTTDKQNSNESREVTMG